MGHPIGDANNQVCHAGPGWIGGIRGTPPVAGVSQHADRPNATISSGRLHAGNCRRDVGSERANGRE